MSVVKKQKGMLFVLAAMLLAALALALYGCGTEYDDVTAQKAEQAALEAKALVVIEPATLKGWIDGGYGTDEFGYSKMVVLDVDSQAGYAAGHIQGAYLYDSSADLSATRSDGVLEVSSQVATKSQMDAVIQRTGIDKDAIIVITGSNLINTGRAYFNMRYWGFPKSRLKVLSGSKAIYNATGADYELTTTLPVTPAKSDYSVCDLTQDTSVRATLQDMIGVSEDSSSETIVVDTRSDDEYNGVAGKSSVPGATGFTSFEGHVKGAKHIKYQDLAFEEDAFSPQYLYDLADVKAAMIANGISATDTTYSYCKTSFRAAVTFLTLDGLLGWPAKLYDGGWLEWGQLATTDNLGALQAGSPWLTNSPSRSEAVTYNDEQGQTVAQVTGNSFALRADDINTDDASACEGGATEDTGAVTGGY